VRVRFFVVAGDGVFFVPAEPVGDAGVADVEADELVFASPAQPPVGTGMVVSWTGYVGASPDGRHLAVVDMEVGEEDRYGTTQATVMAFDLDTGEQVIESTHGMGDPETDDFADGYSESEIGISAMTDTQLYVQGVVDVVFDLETGEARERTGLDPSRDLTAGMQRERRRLRLHAAPRRVVFPAWTYR
jgi:hypothetical protein